MSYFNDYMKRYTECKTLAQFDQLCSGHDWFYYMSDSNLSSKPSEALKKLAEDNGDDWKAIYNKHHAMRFNTESFYPKSDKTRRYAPPFKMKEKK